MLILHISIRFYGALLPGLRGVGEGSGAPLKAPGLSSLLFLLATSPCSLPSCLSATMALSLPPELDTEEAQACHFGFVGLGPLVLPRWAAYVLACVCAFMYMHMCVCV